MLSEHIEMTDAKQTTNCMAQQIKASDHIQDEWNTY